VSITHRLEVEGRAEAAPDGSPVRVASNWARRYGVYLVLIDAAAVLVGALVAQQLRFGELGELDTSSLGFSYETAAMFLAPAWVMTMVLGGAYERRCLGWGTEEYRRVFDSAVRFLAVVAVVALLFQINVVRGYVAIAIPLAAALTLAGRFALRQWMHHMRRRGRFTQRVLVVGSCAATRELVQSLHAEPTGLSVVAACVPGRTEAVEVNGRSVPVLAEPDSALEAVVASQAEVIAIADADTMSSGALRRLAWQLEGTGVDLMVAPAVTDVAGPRISIHPVSDLPLLLVEEPELKGRRRIAKAMFDRLLAALALLVLLPVLVVVGLLVRVTSRGPALFKQVRVGLGGRHFVLWKFRTMTADAESRLTEILYLNEQDGVLFKVRDDPRLTRLGRVLRRWSIDELPQLWNVLKGEMSIVGPRPPLPREVERYDHHVRRRLLVKPGLTGLWQVSGRTGLSWEESVRLDLHYVENWSLSMDAAIILKSVMAVLRGHGAC
jgi:exopolysaccharide biosynthesis polyprenyl glycosylphosphotransferase